MNHNKTWIFYSISAVGLLGLVIGRAVGALFPTAGSTELEELMVRVKRLVEERYVADLEEDELVYETLRSMLGSLDQYSRFYDPSELQRLDEDTNNEYVGVGFGADAAHPDQVVVNYPFRGSPALTGGLRPGDRVVAVEGESVLELPQIDVIQKIRGEQGTEVTLTILRPSGEEVTMRLERQIIRNPAIEDAHLVADGIGYLWVETFDPGLVAEFDAAMDDLLAQGATSLILDLRFNAGGTVESAVSLANRFIGKGLLASTRGRYERSDQQEYRAVAEGLRHPDLPLVVLVNAHSASASEIFAGAIQDHRRGILLGSRTFGKGVIQSLLTLPRSQVAVKLTTAAYYTPAGRAIERQIGVAESNGRRGGLIPDVTFPVDTREMQRIWRQMLWLDIPAEVRDEALDRYRARAEDPSIYETVSDRQIEAAIELLRGEPVVTPLVDSGTEAPVDEAAEDR
ncbi:MAG: S41 family peptidase [Planctomycetota bacterium]